VNIRIRLVKGKKEAPRRMKAISRNRGGMGLAKSWKPTKKKIEARRQQNPPT
jgi:hypothetical protein